MPIFRHAWPRFITNTDGPRSQTISDASSYPLNKTQQIEEAPHEDSDSRINGLAETVADEGEHCAFWSAPGLDSAVPPGPEIKGSRGCWRRIAFSPTTRSTCGENRFPRIWVTQSRESGLEYKCRQRGDFVKNRTETCKLNRSNPQARKCCASNAVATWN